MNGEQLRDIALDNFEIKNQKFLENCRQIATQLIKKNGRVSINDVRKHVKIPSDCNPAILGAVFRPKKFIKTGFTYTKHKEAHNRLIFEWKLK